MRLIVILVSLLVLIGCASNTEPIKVEPRFDPVWPNAIETVDVDWVVDVKDDKAFVGLSYQDSLKLRMWLEDTKRYIIDLQAMVCYYRIGMIEPDKKCLK